MRADTIDHVEVGGMSLAAVTTDELLDCIFDALAEGRGGWIVTANLDFVRRSVRDPAVRALYRAADLRVADGMPLVWAAALSGRPLPERIAGASLLWPLARRAASESKSVYLLGGAPFAASAASERIGALNPGIRLGFNAPIVADRPTPAEVAAIAQELARFAPDVLLVGMGSPKQERLIAELRELFPGTWMIGVGATFSFAAGDLARAPSWMQRSGLEWVHRMIQEPGRLGRRYLLEDLPFAFDLWGRAVVKRAFAGGRRPTR